MTRPRGLMAADPLLAVEGLLRWWLGELLSMVPKQWQYYFSRGETVILSVQRPLPIATAEAEQSGPQVFRIAGVRSLDGLLLLAQELVYRRTIVLPLMSGWRLSKLIRFEAMRFDPMPAAQSCFDYRVIARDFTARSMYVDLFYVRQTSVDVGKHYAAASGLTVCGTCVGSEHLSIHLPRLLRRAGYLGWLSKRQSRLLQRSTAAFAVLAIALITLLVRLQTAELSAQRKMERLRAEVVAIQPERHLRQSIIEEIDAINTERRKSVAIPAMAEITHLLPDTAWLTSMTKTEDSFELRGFAGKASDLVEAFLRSALFHDVRFNGPIVKDGQTNTEQFDLLLRLGAGPP